jgi:hypothetical protein
MESMNELSDKEHGIILDYREKLQSRAIKSILRMFQRWMHRVEGTKPDPMECNFCSEDSRRKFRDTFYKWYDERYN